MLTVGEILKKEREKQGLTYEVIEKKLKIRRRFLVAVEEGDWSQFSSKIYVVGVIKNYAKLLGLPHDKVLAFFRREYAKQEEVAFKKRVSKRLLSTQSRLVIGGAIAAVALLLIIYFGYQVKVLVTPPEVQILAPKTDRFSRISSIEIEGVTNKESEIMIFGNRIFQDENGVFRYDYPLEVGKNTLIVEVTGPNGKKTVYKHDYILERK